MKKLTQIEFISKVKKLQPDIEILGQYVNKRTRIEVKCKKCGNIWSPIADSLSCGHGCSVCASNGKAGKSKPIIIPGVNDLHTTMPMYTKYIKDPQDAYRYTYGSSKKIIWLCPHCKKEVLSPIHQVYASGILCPYCSDGFSYPNKFLYHFLNALHIKFTREFRIENYYYDVLINNSKIIIEIDGGFHFTDNTMTLETKEDVRCKDNMKTKCALDNGYILVRINASKSNVDFIKNSILHSKLMDLLSLHNKIHTIDWNEISSLSQNSLFFETIDLYNNGIVSPKDIISLLPFKVNDTTIYKYLRDGTKLGLCTYIRKNRKMVKCVQDDMVFESIAAAQKYYKFSSNRGICRSCKLGNCCYFTVNGKREKINFEYVDKGV